VLKLLDSFRSSVDTNLEKFLDVFQSVPPVVFVFLILIGLAYLFFGLKIYKFVIGVLGLVLGCVAAYHFTRNLPISAAVGAGVALVAIILNFLFVLLAAGLTLGALAFVGMMVHFQSHVSFLAGILIAIIGIYAAIKLFRFMIIVTTSAIGSAAVTFSVLVLKDQRGISGTVDLTGIVIDEFQMAAGFAGFLLAGMIVQGISWGTSRQEREKS